MGITIERELRIRDNVTADDLLKIPEVDEAVEQLMILQEQHKRALLSAFSDLDNGEWPDIKAINAKHEPELKIQSNRLEKLIRKYAA